MDRRPHGCDREGDVSGGGFHCSGCADDVGESLGRIEGVIKVDADLEPGQMEVCFDPERVGEDDLREGIRTAGFRPA